MKTYCLHKFVRKNYKQNTHTHTNQKQMVTSIPMREAGGTKETMSTQYTITCVYPTDM